MKVDGGDSPLRRANAEPRKTLLDTCRVGFGLVWSRRRMRAQGGCNRRAEVLDDLSIRRRSLPRLTASPLSGTSC